MIKSIKKIITKKDIKLSSVYMLATGIGYGITFLQNIIFAFFVDVEYYGKISLVISLFTLVATLCVLGMDAAFLRFIPDKKIFPSEKNIMSHIIFLWLSEGLLFSTIIIIIGYIVMKITVVSDFYFYPDFVLIVLGGYLFSFITVFQQKYIISEKPFKYASVVIGSRLFILFICITSILWIGKTLSYLSLGLFGGSLIIFLTIIFMSGIFPIDSIEIKKIKTLIIFSYPLGINSLGGVGFTNGFRVILAMLLSYRDLALFNIASQLSSAFYISTSSVAISYIPRVYLSLEDNKGKIHSIKFYQNILIALITIFMPLVAIISFLFLLNFKNGEYYDALKILPFLLFGQTIFLLYSYYYLIITYIKKTKYLTISSFIAIACSLTSAIILTKYMGGIGASIASLFGYLSQIIVSAYFVAKYYDNNNKVIYGTK